MTCPHCGGRGRVLQNGWDDQDRYFRLRRCPDCRRRYATCEVTIPGSFYAFADSYRYKQTLRARLMRGYHFMPQGKWLRRRPQLVIEARVVDAA